MNWKLIVKSLGIAMQYVAATFLAPLIVAIIYQEVYAGLVFITAGVIVFISGWMIGSIETIHEELSLKEGTILVASLWLIVSLLSVPPFMILSDISFIDGWYESMSAWGTIGLSDIIPEMQTRSLLMFRSTAQWIGGVGIVVLSIAGVFKAGQNIFLAEGRTEHLRPNIYNTVKTIWWIYLLYTILSIIALLIVGMPLFDAINHTFTAISTSGLSTHSESIGYYNSFAIEMVLIVVMLMGSVSFANHHRLLQGKIKDFFVSPQQILLVILIFGVWLLIAPIQGSRESLFQIVSAVTTTGFSTVDLSPWTEFSKVLLIPIMIIGGSIGSTSGGIKLLRLWIMIKSTYWRVATSLSPHLIVNRIIEGEKYDSDAVNIVFRTTFMYLVAVLISGIVLMSYGYSAVDSFFQVSSTIGTVGLSVITDTPPLAKFILTIDMWLARLEFWAVIVFVAYFIKTLSNKISE
ncbi:MAG: potassium transporter TrkG [bacterium]|nr:potassium transporter TrkG [bacterium]